RSAQPIVDAPEPSGWGHCPARFAFRIRALRPAPPLKVPRQGSFLGQPQQGSRSVHLFEYFSITEEHVHTAGQTRIEAPHRAHDIDAFKILRAVLLEDGRVLDGVLVGTGSSERIPR